MTKKFTVAGFYAFCRSKPPEESYYYILANACPLARYAKDVLGYQDYPGDAAWNQLTNESAAARQCDVVASQTLTYGEGTYGDLADRIYTKVML